MLVYLACYNQSSKGDLVLKMGRCVQSVKHFVVCHVMVKNLEEEAIFYGNYIDKL